MLSILIPSVLTGIILGFNIGFAIGRSLNKQLLTQSFESCPHNSDILKVQRVYRTIVAVTCNKLSPHKFCAATSDRCMYFTKGQGKKALK